MLSAMNYFLIVAAVVGIVCLLAAIQELLKRDFVRGVMFGVVAFLCAAFYFGLQRPDVNSRPDGTATKSR
jgi:uncharacterized MnhB-related membrane protein